MSNDDFSQAPISIGEARAAKSGLAKDMSVREMLVDFLRDLDSGKIAAPDFAVLCLAKLGVGSESDPIFTSERVGGDQNPLEVYGLLWRCSLRLCDDTRT